MSVSLAFQRDDFFLARTVVVRFLLTFLPVVFDDVDVVWFDTGRVVVLSSSVIASDTFSPALTRVAIFASRSVITPSLTADVIMLSRSIPGEDGGTTGVTGDAGDHAVLHLTDQGRGQFETRSLDVCRLQQVLLQRLPRQLRRLQLRQQQRCG